MIKEYKFVHNVCFDNCAFDPSDSSEQSATFQILKWTQELIVIPTVTRSVLKELEHHNTPLWVRNIANELISIEPVTLEPEQRERLNKIKSIVVGKAREETYENDALHIFFANESSEYFLTTDNRLLKRKNEIKNVSTGIKICKPSEFVKIVEDDKELWKKRMEWRESLKG